MARMSQSRLLTSTALDERMDGLPERIWFVERRLFGGCGRVTRGLRDGCSQQHCRRLGASPATAKPPCVQEYLVRNSSVVPLADPVR